MALTYIELTLTVEFETDNEAEVNVNNAEISPMRRKKMKEDHDVTS